MLIRLSSMSDIDRIMEILDDGRASLKALGIDQWQQGYPYRETIERDIEREESYALVNEHGALVATAVFGVSGKRDYDSIQGGVWLTNSQSEDSRYIVVHRLAVSSEGKGIGAASRLLQEAQSIARKLGKESVRIDTHPGNSPMRRLLAKAGFSECGIIHASHIEKGVRERIVFEKMA